MNYGGSFTRLLSSFCLLLVLAQIGVPHEQRRSHRPRPRAVEEVGPASGKETAEDAPSERKDSPYSLDQLKTLITDPVHNVIAKDKVIRNELEHHKICFELNDKVLEELRGLGVISEVEKQGGESQALNLLKTWHHDNKKPTVKFEDPQDDLDVLQGKDIILSVTCDDPDKDVFDVIWESPKATLQKKGDVAILKTKDMVINSGHEEVKVAVTAIDRRGGAGREEKTIVIRRPLDIVIPIKREILDVFQGQLLELPVEIRSDAVEPVRFSWKLEGKELPETGKKLMLNTQMILTDKQSPILTIFVTATDSQGARGSAPQKIRLLPSASLRLASKIEGVNIALDGVSRGIIAQEQDMRLFLSPDYHTLEATKNGFYDWKCRVKGAVNAETQIDILMERLPDEVLRPRIAAHLQEAIRHFEYLRYDEALAECDKGLALQPDNRALQDKKKEIEADKPVHGPDFKPAARICIPRVIFPQTVPVTRGPESIAVQVTIDKRGNVTKVKVLEGNSSLAKYSDEAARKCKYNPATEQGRPVPDRQLLYVDIVYPSAGTKP